MALFKKLHANWKTNLDSPQGLNCVVNQYIHDALCKINNLTQANSKFATLTEISVRIKYTLNRNATLKVAVVLPLTLK